MLAATLTVMGVAAQCLHGAGLCLLPKPENDHRPWLLRHGPLSFVSSLLIVAKVLGFGIIALTPTPAELSTITTNRIVQLTNNERKKVGLSELTVSGLLTQAAAAKGQHMLDEDYFAHISPSGVTPWFWMNKVGYSYQVAGENLAIDFVEAEDVVAAWLASPTHKDNMLHSSYTQTGVGVVSGEFQGGTSTLVVHMFGLPAGAAALPTPTPASVPAVKSQTTSTPAPSPSPTPPVVVPTPLPSPDVTPPRIPRIAVAAQLVPDSISIDITGDPFSTVALLVNNQVRATVALQQEGQAVQQVSIADLPDGQLLVRAYATDTVGNQSDATSPVALTKDTAGPHLALEQVSFLLSPASDVPAMAALVAGEYTGGHVIQDEIRRDFSPHQVIHLLASAGPFDLSLRDEAGNVTTLEHINITPAYASEENQQFLVPPTRFSQLTRRLSAGIAAALAALLLLAILVRIRIQKPSMIAHASMVILLAAVLFLL